MQKKDIDNAVRYDLNIRGELCEGTVTFADGIVCACADSREEFSRNLEGIKEARQFTDIGCGRLELVPEGCDDFSQNLTVCRFSMASVNDIGELCKVINHYIKHGKITEVSHNEAQRCPECGKPLIPGINACMFCVKKTYLFSRALKLMKPYSRQLLISSLLLILADGCAAVVPILNRVLTDNYLAPAGGISAGAETYRGIFLIAALLILSYAGGRVLTIFSGILSNRIGSMFSNDLRLTVYDKIQTLSLTALSKKTAGDLIKRVTRDTTQIRDFFTDQGKYAIEQGLMFIIVTIILLFTSPLLTLLVLVPIPIFIVVIFKLWGYIHLRYERQWKMDSRATSILHDIIKGIRVVKSFGNEKREISKFANASEKLADVSSSNERFWSLTFPFIGFFMGAGEFLVMFIGGRMVLDGEMTLGELTQFTMFLAYLYNPIRWFSSLPRWLANAATSLIKIFEIIDEEHDLKDTLSPAPLNAGGQIVFDEVQFGYKAYEPVLEDINLTINPGEMIGLVGHSGAGKSTMINLIMRLYDTDVGSVKIDGVSLKDIDQHVLRENIGVVFQETFLFSGSVYDNIAYAKPDATYEEVIAAAKTANAHEFIMKLPDGYNTPVGENGHNLSGGERQRIAIARAVLKNPKILILDEATSSLDPETEGKIQEALNRLTKNRTTVAIAHRLSTLRNADRLVVLEHGKIAQVGSHQQLMEEKGIYYNLVMAQRQTAKVKK
ncbi:MAG: ABC transporter ATP-binding protein [Clostridiales bacterium]|nr:ABC transporter ATP-binding protein [Clostridiales bacterium]